MSGGQSADVSSQAWMAGSFSVRIRIGWSIEQHRFPQEGATQGRVGPGCSFPEKAALVKGHPLAAQLLAPLGLGFPGSPVLRC